MADHPKDSTDQPFRALFLFNLEPEAREALERAGFFVENAMLETYAAPASEEPFPVSFSGALLDDLDAVLFQLRCFLQEWTAEGAGESGGGGLRESMEQLYAGLVEGRRTLLRALDEAGRTG